MTDKEAFFSRLDQLDCLSDTSEGEFDCLFSTSRPKDEKVSPGSGQFEKPSPSPPVIINSPSDAVAVHSVVSAPSITLTREACIATNVRQKSMGEPSKHLAKDAPGKRKRGPSGKIIPEHLQILKGLVFCKAFSCHP